MTNDSAIVTVGQIGDISQVSGMLAIGGDVVVGNKTVIQHIVQQAARELIVHPYKFLSAYDISDKDIFFGRDALTKQLAGKIPRHKVLLINGVSGSGKSSLINAGLIPYLAENGYTYLSFRDYSNPLKQMQKCLVDSGILSTVDSQPELLLHTLTAFRNAKIQVVFVFDQFERFFVNVPSKARVQFIKMVKVCMETLHSSEMNVIFSMREEFFGQFQREFEHIIHAFINECDRVNIEPLSKAEARQAIIEPLKKIQAKIGYDDEFVDNILLVGLEAEIAEKGISPPHLQIVCNQLYQAACQQLEHKSFALINHELYEQLGGTQTILRTYLDDCINSVANREDAPIQLLRSLLKQMIETVGIRKFVTAQQLHDNLPDVASAQIDRFLKQLQNERVIEMRSQEKSYSLSHEVMVAKVKDWFDEREMARKRAAETLEHGLNEWKNSETLLAEKQIKRIRDAQIKLNTEAEEFLRSSEAECDRQHREEAERKRKEEEQIQQLALERETRQHALDSRRKIMQIGFVVAIILTIIAMGFGIYSYVKFKEAQKNESLVLAYLSRQKFEEGDATTAMLLALEALPKNMESPDRPYVFQAEHRLHHAFYAPRIEHIPKLGLEESESIDSVTFSHNSQNIIVVSHYGDTAKIRSITDGKVTGEPVPLKHEKEIYSVELSSDGQKVVTRSDDNTVKIWKMTGELIDTLELEHIVLSDQIAFNIAQIWNITDRKVTDEPVPLRHKTSMYRATLTLSPDGQKVMTIYEDNTVKIWEVTGKPIATLKHEGYFYREFGSAEFSPDSQKVVTISEDKTVKIWEVTGKPIATLKHEGYVYRAGFYSAEFSPDSQKVVTISEDKTAKIWKVTGEAIATLQHEDKVDSAEFSPDSQKVVTRSDDNTAKIWKVTGDAIATLKHEGSVDSAEFSPDGQKVVTASGGTAKIWKVTGDAIATLKHDNFVRSAEFSPDGQKVVTASFDNTAKIWKVTGEPIATTLKHEGSVDSAEFSPDGQKVVTASGKTAKIWKVTGEPIATLEHEDKVDSAEFSPDGQKVVTVSDSTAQIWNITDGKVAGEPIATLKHDSFVRSAEFSPDGQKVVTASSDKAAKIWNWKVTGEVVTLDHEGFLNSAKFSPDSQKVVTASWDNTAKIWKVTGESIATLEHEDFVFSAEFSPNGQKVVTASVDKTAKIWKVTGEPIATLEHEDFVFSAEFSPNGQKVVTASVDKTAKIWNWKVTGELIATLEHNDNVSYVEFSPDSQKIAIISGSNVVKIWEVSSGKQLITFPTSSVAAFSSDWKSILLTSGKIATILKPFNSTQELIDAARKSIPEGLNTEDWKESYLTD